MPYNIFSPISNNSNPYKLIKKFYFNRVRRQQQNKTRLIFLRTDPNLSKHQKFSYYKVRKILRTFKNNFIFTLNSCAVKSKQCRI